MNLSIILSFVLVQLFIDHFSLQVMACSTMSRIDSITNLYYRGIAYVLTSNGYYYIIREDDIDNDVNEYGVSGKISDLLANCCDSSIYKDIDGCEREDDNEHSISFLKYTSEGSKYISLNIEALRLNEQTDKIWSKPKTVMNDIILSGANIDYSRRIDAIFHFDNSGEHFFIQGEHYSGIEFEGCPRDRINKYKEQPLHELNVFGKIDSAYYDQETRFLYLLHYDQMQFYKVEIDHQNSKDGKLVSLNTTKHPISSHPIFSKICAPNSQYNSSLLSAENPLNDMSSDVSIIISQYSLISIVFNIIFWYLII